MIIQKTRCIARIMCRAHGGIVSRHSVCMSGREGHLSEVAVVELRVGLRVLLWVVAELPEKKKKEEKKKINNKLLDSLSSSSFILIKKTLKTCDTNKRKILH